jgi:hypothetical protein
MTSISLVYFTHLKLITHNKTVNKRQSVILKEFRTNVFWPADVCMKYSADIYQSLLTLMPQILCLNLNSSSLRRGT